MPSTTKVSQWMSRIPLRLLLFGLATIPTILVAIFVGALALWDKEQAIDRAADQTLTEISTHIRERLELQATIPPRAVGVSQTAFNLGQLDFEELQSWSNHLFLQLQNNPGLIYIFFSDTSGRYVEASTFPNTNRIFFGVRPTAESLTLFDHHFDSNGNLEEPFNQRDYDTFSRPWYQQAVALSSPGWTDIYTFVNPSHRLGLSFVSPHYDANGELIGFFGADFTLGSLEAFLIELSAGEPGEIAIFERNGTLVASSVPGLIGTDPGRRVHAEQINTPLLRTTLDALEDQSISLAELTSPIQLTLRLESEAARARIVPFSDSFGLDWIVTVTIPETELLGGTQTATKLTVVFSILVTVIAAAISLSLARWLENPLQSLAQIARDFTRSGDLMPAPVAGPPETRAIAQSHNRMAENLKDLLQDLEQKVAERTQELDLRLQELKETRDNLFESETQLVEAQRVAKVGNWIWSPGTRYFDCSAETIRLMDIGVASCKRVPVKLLLRRVIGSDRARLFQCFSSTLDTGDAFEAEVRILLPHKSEVRDIQVQGEVRHDPTDQSTKLFGTILDITRLKRAETISRTNEERWQLALQGNNDGIWDWDIESGQTFHSERLEQILGYSSGELSTHNHWSECIHPHDRFRVIETLQQHLDRQTSYYVAEYRLRCCDGSYKWILDRGQALWNETGQPTRMVGSHTDISIRKLSEEALREREERFRTLVSNIPGAVYRSLPDRDWTMNYISEAVTELSGYPASDFVNCEKRSWNSIIHADDRELVRTTIDVAIAQDLPFTVEYRIVRSNGKIRWLYEKGQGLRNTEGQITYLDGAIFDISELKAVEAELETSKREADAANQAKSQFLASMSHELRTPLNGILGYAQLLERSPNLSPEHISYLEVINHSGEHLLELINDVLDLAKIEAGQMGINPSSFDLYNLLDTLETLMQLRAGDKGLALSFQRSETVPRYIKADAGKLRQILINLLENAIKFTVVGEVILRSDCSKVRDTALCLEFRIEDTGPGIPPVQIDTIFELFVQVNAGKQAKEGTGLGLPISRKFARMMGGDLTVTNRLGGGAAFHAHLTVAPASAADVPRTLARQVISLAPDEPIHKVLVVEDNPVNRGILVRLLKKVGFTVRIASNGLEAIAEWETWEPDFIWMDLRMPEMDGIEATRQIRKLEQERELTYTIPILVITASLTAEEIEEALEAGCNDWLSKPYKAERIYEKMVQYLGVQFKYHHLQQNHDLQSNSVDLEDLVNDLRIMPDSWIETLHFYAQCLDEEGVISLLESPILSYEQIGMVIESWAKSARFDRIMTLTTQLMDKEAS